jgi:peptide/nickel transport system substrate-binding protein
VTYIKKTSTLASATCAALLAAAWAGSGAVASTAPPADSGGGEACEATVPGSQLDYGIFAPNSAFDPTGTSGALVGGTENAAVWDMLFRWDPETGEVVPKLAESLTPNEDFTAWTLKLREGITYSDGTPLTAQLVSDNIDRFFATEGVRNTSAGFLQYIAEKTAVDDLTLEMTLNTAYAEFPQVFADEPGMVVNLNAIGDDLDAFRVQPPDAAGLGPYIVERNVPGEETILKARSDYWDGPVCIETLRFVYIPGAAPTYDAFRNGELDAAFLRDPIVTADVEADGVQHFWFDQDCGGLLTYNHREGRPTSDIRLREALSLAIDPQIISDRAFQGALETTKSLFGAESRWMSDAVEEQPYDPERASQLVEEVKADGWDGTLNFVGVAEGTGPDTALAIQGMLAAVGVDAEPELIPQVDSIGRMGAGEFDIIGNGFNCGPDTALLSLIRNLSSTSPTNRMGYVSPAMDELLNQALATPVADLAPVMAEINNQLNADWAAAPYSVGTEGLIWADNVSGIVPTYSSIFLFDNAAIDG